MTISTKRVYETAAQSDGKRILVDRIWPRGLTKAKAKIDLWLKDVAPSTELRKWFSHDPEKGLTFKRNTKRSSKPMQRLPNLRQRLSQIR